MKVAGQFELAVTLAVFMIAFDPNQAGDLAESVIATYNAMTRKDDNLVMTVGQTVAEWTAAPSDNNFGRLVALFRLMRKNIK